MRRARICDGESRWHARTPYLFTTPDRTLRSWSNQLKLRWIGFAIAIDTRPIFSRSIQLGNFIVFNIKGNNYRLIVGIDYERQIVYYKYFLTHADYSKDKWKNDSYF
jgi:mRNA-degrading endonuclease HigB of HigAB toxin-antitoxin module